MENTCFFDHYTVVGLSYRKADAHRRGKYALNTQQIRDCLQYAKNAAVKDFFLLSTCNRTELYGLCGNPSELLNVLFHVLGEGERQGFTQLCYQKRGRDAMEHLCKVTAGLDSQILGDYEIVSQVKAAMRLSKEYGCLQAEGERLLNTALRIAKSVKSTTGIGVGTTSVSFAAARCVERFCLNCPGDATILLVGLGEIGTNTLKHLQAYIGGRKLYLINRTREKIAHLASETTTVLDWRALPQAVNQADMVIVATSAPHPIVHSSFFTNIKPRLLLDLSVPHNIDPGCRAIPMCTLHDVDALSEHICQVIAKRQAELPKTQAIVNTHLDEFCQWLVEHKRMHSLKSIKLCLEQLSNQQNVAQAQKCINTWARQFRAKEKVGCSVIQTYQRFLCINNG